MGNCLKLCGKTSSAVAAGEDTAKTKVEAEAEAAAAYMDSVSEGVLSSSRSVKIKMTKREMKELFERVEKKGIPVGEALGKLLENRGNISFDDEGGDCSRCGGGGGAGVAGGTGVESEMQRQQSWRPMLQSISEIDQFK